MQDIYFVQDWPDGPIKIGRTKDVRHRLSCLKNATWRDLRLIGVIPGGGKSKEMSLHARFAPTRIRGEWFEPSSELIGLITALPKADLEILRSGYHGGSSKSAYAIQWRARNEQSVDEYNRSRRELRALARGSMEQVCQNPECAKIFVGRLANQKWCSRRCNSRTRELRRAEDGYYRTEEYRASQRARRRS